MAHKTELMKETKHYKCNAKLCDIMVNISEKRFLKFHTLVAFFFYSFTPSVSVTTDQMSVCFHAKPCFSYSSYAIKSPPLYNGTCIIFGTS